MFPNSAMGIACPGCGPNDFPVPHICGAGMRVIPQMNLSPFSSSPTCEHCWCTQDRSTARHLRDFTTVFVTKVHDVCCGCGSRRATDEDLYPKEAEES